MARKGRFGTGGSGQNYSSDIKSYIAQSLGTDAVPTDSTETVVPKVTRPSLGSLEQQVIATRPDYSGLDFTGLDKQGINRLKKSVRTPEYTAARRALRARRIELATPFTEREIATDATKRAIAGGITYEQALANYRKLVKVMNLVPMAGKERTKRQERRFRRLNAALTPEQRDAQRILGMLGGFGTHNYRGKDGETGQERFYRRLGMTAPTTRYAPINEEITMNKTFGPQIKIANPLSQQQRSRLQRLRSIGASSLTKRQQAALARLRALKNAPTILSGEE